MADYDNPRPSTQPVGTTEQGVLKDNLITTDMFVVGDELTVTNRKGREFDSFAGIQLKVNEAIQNAGGVPINGGVWAAGQTFNAYNEYMVYNGVAYKPKASTPLPYGPTGATPDTNFVQPFGGTGVTDAKGAKGETQAIGYVVYPNEFDKSASTSAPYNSAPSGTTALRDAGQDKIYVTSETVTGSISALDFGAGTATVGGVSVTLTELSVAQDNDINEKITTLTDLLFSSVSDMKTGSGKVTESQIDAQDVSARTQGYYGGWAASTEPDGAAEYILTRVDRVLAVDPSYAIDEKTDHYLFGGTTYVAMLNEVSEFDAKQSGAKLDGLDTTDELRAALAYHAKKGIKLNITGKHYHSGNLPCVTSGSVNIEFSGDGELVTMATATDQVSLWVSHLPYLEDITQYYDPANRPGGTPLAVNAGKSSKTIEVVDGSIFSKGDFVYIISTDDWLASASIKNGMNRKINDVTGNVITLDGSLGEFFNAATTTCYPYRPPVVSIKNPKLTGPNNGNSLIGIHLYECQAVDLDGQKVEGFNLRDTQLYFCVGGQVNNSNNDFADKTYVSGGRSSYSLAINGSRDITVSKGTLRGGRHALSTGGYIPNYNINIDNLTCYSADFYGNNVASLDFHEGTVNSSVRSCTVYGGLDCAGENLDIIGNTVFLSDLDLRVLVVRVYRSCDYINMNDNHVFGENCAGGVVLRQRADNVAIKKVCQNNNTVDITTNSNRPGVGIEPTGFTGSKIEKLEQSDNQVSISGSAVNAIGIGNHDINDLASLVDITNTTVEGNVVRNEAGTAIDHYCSAQNNGTFTGNTFETAVSTFRAVNLRGFSELNYNENHAIMDPAGLAANSANLFRDIVKLNISGGSFENSYYNGYRLLNVSEVNPVNVERINCVENPADTTRVNAKFVAHSWVGSDSLGTAIEAFNCTVSRTALGVYRVALVEPQSNASFFPVLTQPQANSVTIVDRFTVDLNFGADTAFTFLSF